MRRTPGALALYALVTIALVGATSAFVVLNKQVTLSVDGKTREVSSFAGSVRGVLQSSEVQFGPRDLVVPSPDEPVGHDSRIVVTHARQLKLTVDGETSRVWVTANTVKEALNQLNVNAGKAAALSASRSSRLPLDGFALNVRLPRKITVKVSGSTLKRETAAPTIRKALVQAGIKLGPHDRIDADPGERPKPGQVIHILQVVGKPDTRTVTIDHKTERRADSDLLEGKTEVVQEGRDGVKKVVTATVLHKGKKVEKVISSEVTRKPRKQIVRYGTKQPEPSGGGPVPSEDGLNWAALAECESGGNPNAVNPAGPYYGLYQFSLPTWQSVGGTGLPSEASSAEQTARAQKLYQSGGDEQWPVCGEHLYD